MFAVLTAGFIPAVFFAAEATSAPTGGQEFSGG